jgi:hypothetical protein
VASGVVNITALQVAIGAPMVKMVTPSRRVGHRGTQIVGSALSGILNGMKGLILSALMICVVVLLVRHPPGAVFKDQDVHHDER